MATESGNFVNEQEGNGFSGGWFAGRSQPPNFSRPIFPDGRESDPTYDDAIDQARAKQAQRWQNFLKQCERSNQY